MSESSGSDKPKYISPRWSSTTKLIIGLSFVAILALLLVQLRSWIGPLILAFVLAYLLYPLAVWLKNRTKMSWSLSVGLIYIIIILALLGLLTWGGIAFIEPVQNFIRFLQKSLNQLPELIGEISQLEISFGPIDLDFSTFDLSKLVEQLLGMVQPLVTSAGSLLGSFATGAAAVIGRILFLLLISYFILAETKGAWDKIIDIDLPGYGEDLRRFGLELNRIWNAFLRGQLILMLIAIIAYTFLLSIFGMRFVIGLALLAGLARFVPYVGPWVTWITYFLVALLQGQTIFGLSPFPYAVIVVGVALLTDTVIDNFVVPRIYANALRVHPAAVLVAILVSAAWLGLIGVVLAAPVLATLKLFWNYAFQKLFDRDPWENLQVESRPPPKPPGYARILPQLDALKARLSQIRIFRRKKE